MPPEGHQARHERELHQGLITAAVTATADCSDVVERSFVTNSNEAKTEHGVPAELIGSAGALSDPIAQGMAEELPL